MPLTAGDRLGHYEIVALIGAGGMGEVYRARDPRLNRTVAIKVLIDDLSREPDARARFEREAQAIAGLNHPHIATLHDVGRHGQTDYLVMELLEGDTLAEHLARGRLPLPRAMQYGIEIAAALDQAHRHGVVHRDLKPANVMVTRDGVKLLDFGLAKLKPTGNTDLTVEATRTGMTSEGTILGTLQYMAPEQVEGGPVDARTDIFAFGMLLHEMLTGRRAFAGRSRMALAGSILKDMPPPASTLDPSVPAALDRLIATCLAKDPDDRWQSTRDVWRELTWIAASGGPAAPVEHSVAAVTHPSPRVGLFAAIALAAAAIAAAAAWLLKPEATASRPLVARLTLTLPPGDRLGSLQYPSIALSPDGTAIVYVGQRERGDSGQQLFIRSLDSTDAQPLAGTEGAASPFFSPDGQWLAFFADGSLKKAQRTGSAPPQVVCPATGAFGGAWGPDDTIYFVPSPTAGVWKVPATGGAPQQVTTIDHAGREVSHRWPEILPGGKALILTVWMGPGSDEKHLKVQVLATGERRDLLSGASTGRYISTGHLLYSRDDAVMAVPFDLATLQVTGSPVAMPERAFDDEGAQFSTSASGALAHVLSSARRFERRLVWVTPGGGVERLSAPLRPYTDPVISPDGRYAAFTNIGPVETIWIHDLSRGTQTALTPTTNGSSQSAVWTSDGTHIVYRGTRSGFRNLYQRAVDGSSDEERVTTSEFLQTPTSASPDQYLAFVESVVATGSDIWVLKLGTHEPRVFLKSPAYEGNPRFSPDGRWLAYTSTDSGVREVYVRPFPGPGGKLQISNGGGGEPVWSHSGRELFYRRGDQMMSVPIVTTPALSAGLPKVLFEGDYLRTDTGGAGYDVSPTGRFLMVEPVEPELPATSINIVMNWFDDLKRRVSAEKP